MWSDPKNVEDLLEKTRWKRIGETEDVARKVVVLVPDLASYLTSANDFGRWWDDRLSRLL